MTNKSRFCVSKRKENCENLKYSWKHQASQFFEVSTLHGVRYIAEKNRPFIERFMWFFCVSTGAVATVAIIMSLWEKFQTSPTITGLDTDFHSWDVPFPAITLCEHQPGNETLIDSFIESNWPDVSEENKEDKRILLTKLVQLSYDNIADFMEFTKDKDITKLGISLKDIVFKLVNRCEDFLFNCQWKGEDYDCCSGFFPILTEHGFCYTFNSRHYENYWPWLQTNRPPFVLKYIQETDIKWAISFDSTQNDTALVFIHNSDEVPSADLSPQHVWDKKVDKISFTVKETYTTLDARQLTIKQRKCAFEDEIKLKIDIVYTYTACTRQCRMETSRKLCGCIPFFYTKIPGHSYCNLEELQCVIENINTIKSVDKCSCELGCSNSVYEVEKLNEAGEDLVPLEIEFVSWPMVRYKREVLFGWVDLLVAFGGIAGLFLGFSLLSGVEIIYYFTVRTMCMFYRDKEELEILKHKEFIKEDHFYDLNLKPYFVEKPFPGYGVAELFSGKRTNKVFNIKVKSKDPGRNGIYPPFGIEFLN